MNDEDANDMVSMAVDDEICIGAGQCEMFEEDTFVIDEDTMVATVIGSGQLPRERAETMVEKCPSGAISIVDGTTTPTAD